METICKIVIQFQSFGRNAISPLYCLMEQYIRGFCFRDDVLEELRPFASIYIVQKPERGDIIDTHTFEELSYINIEPKTSYSFTFIINAKSFRNMSDIIPLLLLQREFQGLVSIGVNLNDYDVKEQQKLIFKFSSFLLFLNDAVPVNGFHSFYFINEKGERHNYTSNDSIATSYYYISNNRVTALRYKGAYSNNSIDNAITQASRYFQPLLHVDKTLFDCLFQNAQVTGSPEVDYIVKSIEKLSSGIKEIEPTRIGFSSLFERWFFLAFYYSLPSDELKNINATALYSTLHDYYIGIYELVQNIIFHTEEQQGWLYVMFCKEKDLSDEDKANVCKVLALPAVNRFLKVGVYDFSAKGIPDTFCEDNHLDNIELSELIDPHVMPKRVDITDKVDSLSFTYAAHLGIKMLVSSVMYHDGWFHVESCQRGEKYVISGSSSSIDTQKKLYNVRGTQYEIVLPVTELKHNDTFPIQSSSVADFLKAHLKSPIEIDAININDCIDPKSMSKISSMDVQWKMIEDIADNIVSKINISSSNNSYSSVGIYALNMEGVLFPNPNQIFKLLACLQLKHQAVKTLVLVNLPDSTITHLCRIVKQVASIKTERQQPLWSRDNAVVLYGNTFGASIFCGENLSEMSNVNKSMMRIYPGHKNYLAEIVDVKNDSQLNVLDQLVMPYECLIRVNCVPLFLQLTKNELDKTLGSPTGGYLIDDFRTKLGSKLYMERFFEADTIFQNGFFVERFAYFIALDMLKRLQSDTNLKNKPIVIVGCYSYSEPLSRTIQYYINHVKNAFVKQVVTAIEVEDENNMAFHWQDMQTGSLSKFNDSYAYALIVPISSTLSSHDKTISFFKKNTGNSTISFPYQYSVLLIRDKELSGATTAIEKDWNIVDITSGVAHAAYNDTKLVRFLIEKGSHWHNLLDKETFPDRFQDEVFLNRTKNASLNTKDYFGFPVAAHPNKEDMEQELNYVMGDRKTSDVLEDYYTLTCKRLNSFSNYIYIGHIEHHDNHHRYYFNTEGYVSHENKEEFVKWLDYQKHKFGKVVTSKVSCVIITPDVNKESCFVDRVNEEVFEGHAFIIHLDVYSSMQNISYKYAFLQHLPHNCKFFYVDHAILTGGTFHRTRQMMSFANDNKLFKFDGIITVVNRLSFSLFDQISDEVGQYGVESYIWFSILPSQNTYSDCSLCGLERHYSLIGKHTVNRDVKLYCNYNRNKFCLSHLNYYTPQSNDEPSSIETAIDYHRKIRMMARYKLFYHISLLAKEVGNNYRGLSSEKVHQIIADKIKKYMQKEFITIGNNVDEKISFLKAITFPPLSQYVHIREFAFTTNLKELSIILNKAIPDYNDFCLLKAILKHLAYLSSNALVREKVIVGAWELCGKVLHNIEGELKKKYDEENACLTNKKTGQVRKHKITDLFDAKLKTDCDNLEYQKKQLEKFKVNLLFYIKTAIYNDESKSFFLGELMRTGKEPDVNRPLEIHASTGIAFADFDDLSDFRDRLYYDNNTILRKTLSNFGKEIEKKTTGLYRFFKNENGNLLPLEEFEGKVNIIVELLLDIIKDNYYYMWFRMYVSEDSINKGQLIDYNKDGVPLIRKLVYLLYAKLLFDQIEQGKRHDYINDVKTLLRLSLLVMDATEAFIVINPSSNCRKRILAYCGNYKINEFSEASYIDLVNKISNDISHSPFLITEDEYLFSELHNANYKKGCFLPLYLETPASTPRMCIGVVSFLYESESQKFRIRKKECARLLMLLGEEMDRYNAHCKFEKFFEIWYDQEETKRKYRKTNFTSNHRLQLGNWDFESLDTDSYVKIYNTIFMMSNVVVSHLYSVISAETKINFISNIVSIRNIFSDNFIALLNKLNYERWDGTLQLLDVENANFRLKCHIVIMQSLIIQCIENAYGKYADRSKRISISFGSKSFTISNTIVNVDVDRLKRDEIKFKEMYNPDVLRKNISLGRLSNYGMTLVSLFGYCESVGMKCLWDFNIMSSPYFKVEVLI